MQNTLLQSHNMGCCLPSVQPIKRGVHGYTMLRHSEDGTMHLACAHMALAVLMLRCATYLVCGICRGVLGPQSWQMLGLRCKAADSGTHVARLSCVINSNQVRHCTLNTLQF